MGKIEQGVSRPYGIESEETREFVDNFPHEFIGIDEYTEKYLKEKPGVDISDSYLELAKLINYIKPMMTILSGRSIPASEMEDIDKDSSEEKMRKLERIKELLKEKIEKEQKFLESLDAVKSKLANGNV